MRLLAAAFFLAVLGGCASAPPQHVTYSLANRPLAVNGTMKWSDYYEGLYAAGAASGMPSSDMQRANEMIMYSRRYEAGAISKDQFDYQRRLAQIGSNSDAAAAREHDRARWAAVGAAMSAAAANQQNIAPYQIVQPVQLQAAPAYQIQPLQSAGVTASWTGKQHQVQTVTNQFGWSCEYNYAGRTFTRVFTTSCPSSVQVQ